MVAEGTTHQVMAGEIITRLEPEAANTPEEAGVIQGAVVGTLVVEVDPVAEAEAIREAGDPEVMAEVARAGAEEQKYPS